MATVKQVVGAKTDITPSGLATLPSATYIVSANYDCTINKPLDLFVELLVTCGSTAGNKQAVIFAQASLDGAAWQSGPTSGTATGDEANLTLVGVVPLATSFAPERKAFNVAPAFGGTLPPNVRFVIKNDSGAAFTASSSLSIAEVSVTVA